MTVIGGRKNDPIDTAKVRPMPDGRIDPQSKHFFVLRAARRPPRRRRQKSMQRPSISQSP
jgi:hypothetical protein